MRRRAFTLTLLVGAALSFGCAQTRQVIKTQTYDFAGARASARDFPRGAICEAEPRFLLDEISSVNALLKRFLRAVPGEGRGEWTDEAIALVEDGSTRLPPLLDLHGRSLTELARCPFAATGVWPDLLARGRELLKQTQTRLDTAPAELAELRKKRAYEAWQAERLAAEEAGKRACPAKSRSPVVAFAWRESGITTWLFCDGAKVTREGQQRPMLEPAPEETKGKRPNESAYLVAAGKYPGGAVLAPPAEAVVGAW